MTSMQAARSPCVGVGAGGGTMPDYSGVANYIPALSHPLSFSPRFFFASGLHEKEQQVGHSSTPRARKMAWVE